jgi:nuclear transport factor 2 (NTF2) superfamily protein
MNTEKKFPTPPWNMDTAAERLIIEEAAWNTQDPERIIQGYTDNVEMRDGVDFITGKEELKQFLKTKFKHQLGYTLKLDLWGALHGRMAVRFESEWHDASGQWYRSYGIQVFQFNDAGYAERRFASQETVPIGKAELRVR